MEKVLSQDEIDVLFRAAQNQGIAAAEPGCGYSRVERWDLYQVGLLGKDQLHSISQLHEVFARNLSTSVGAYLRNKFEVVLVSVEQLGYRDLLARTGDATYYALFQLLPSDAIGILQIDLSLVFPVVDLMLGGQGSMPPSTREVTAIEEMVLEGVGQLICHELQAVWQPLGLEIVFDQRQPASQMQRVMPGQEKTLTVSFEATMADSHGMLNIAFPAVVSSALLRKLAKELVYQRPHGQAMHQPNILKRLLDSTVEVELGTPLMSLKLSDILSLRAGGVLVLRQHIDEPATLRLQGRDYWLARPVRSNINRRAAQLLDRLVQPEEEVD